MGANATKIGKGVIEITPNATFDTDWNIADEGFPNGIKLGSIKFWGSAANDILGVRDGGPTGPLISKMKDVTPAGVGDDFDGIYCKPYIDTDDCTLGTPANARIIIEYL